MLPTHTAPLLTPPPNLAPPCPSSSLLAPRSSLPYQLLAPPPPAAALRRPSFGASIPMAHDLSLSDFDLPTPDDLDGTAATSTPGGSARLKLEEEG